jgi:hypothetical protein
MNRKTHYSLALVVGVVVGLRAPLHSLQQRPALPGGFTLPMAEADPDTGDAAIAAGLRQKTSDARTRAKAFVEGGAERQAIEEYLWIWQHLAWSARTSLANDLRATSERFSLARRVFAALRNDHERDLRTRKSNADWRTVHGWIQLNEVLGDRSRTTDWLTSASRDPAARDIALLVALVTDEFGHAVVLVARGADPNVRARVRNGMTPLTRLINVPSRDARRLLALNALIRAGARVNELNSNGRTVLMNALWLAEDVRLLLDGGADPLIRDAQGRTVLDQAEASTYRGPQREEIIGMLRDAQRNPRGGATTWSAYDALVSSSSLAVMYRESHGPDPAWEFVGVNPANLEFQLYFDLDANGRLDSQREHEIQVRSGPERFEVWRNSAEAGAAAALLSVNRHVDASLAITRVAVPKRVFPGAAFPSVQFRSFGQIRPQVYSSTMVPDHAERTLRTAQQVRRSSATTRTNDPTQPGNGALGMIAAILSGINAGLAEARPPAPAAGSGGASGADNPGGNAAAPPPSRPSPPSTPPPQPNRAPTISVLLLSPTVVATTATFDLSFTVHDQDSDLLSWVVWCPNARLVSATSGSSRVVETGQVSSNWDSVKTVPSGSHVILRFRPWSGFNSTLKVGERSAQNCSISVTDGPSGPWVNIGWVVTRQQ